MVTDRYADFLQTANPLLGRVKIGRCHIDFFDTLVTVEVIQCFFYVCFFGGSGGTGEGGGTWGLGGGGEGRGCGGEVEGKWRGNEQSAEVSQMDL